MLHSNPHQQILLNTLGLQEAKDSSAIENIVTTHDEIYRTDLFPDLLNPAAKEVANYRQAGRSNYYINLALMALLTGE